MPNFTIEKKDGGLTCVERKDKKEAEKFAKEIGGKVVYAGSDHGDDENHPNIVRDKARAEAAKGSKSKPKDDEEE